MYVRAYVLIEAEVGQSKAIGEAVASFKSGNAKLLGADTVTGPYDVVVHLESDDLDKLGTAISQEIQSIKGVERTTTLLAVKIA